MADARVTVKIHVDVDVRPAVAQLRAQADALNAAADRLEAAQGTDIASPGVRAPDRFGQWWHVYADGHFFRAGLDGSW